MAQPRCLRLRDVHLEVVRSLFRQYHRRVKPDPQCFTRALQACNADVAQVAFFDDALVNVAAAEALGIQAFHVNGLSEVQRSLAEMKWL